MKPVRTNKLSEHINASASSVSDMLQKLQEKALVHYEKYRGARLSAKGCSLALDIIRRHRLWEVFLHEKLQLDSYHVHQLAEQLEHVQDKGLIARLDAYLGYPRYDPHGASIPTAEGNMAVERRCLLWGLPVGQLAQLVSLRQGSPALRRHLKHIGLQLGDTLEVQARETYDGSVQVYVEARQKTYFISEKVARNLYMQKK